MIAVGIGLHNLGEGLAIGSAYAVGELALGTALVVGFALHNTTEGIAVVAPLAGSSRRRASLPLLAGLGLVAGAPAIIGALLGASVDNAELSAFLLGIGVGAIVQVIVQLAPRCADGSRRAATLPPSSASSPGPDHVRDRAARRLRRRRVPVSPSPEARRRCGRTAC